MDIVNELGGPEAAVPKKSRNLLLRYDRSDCTDATITTSSQPVPFATATHCFLGRGIFILSAVRD